MTKYRHDGGHETASPELTVVLPVYQNVETLAELTERLHRILDANAISHQLLFIDDACPQGSGELLSKLAGDDQRIKIVHLPKNVGQHAAVLAGLNQSSSPWIAVMDADLQDSPEEIPGLFKQAQEKNAIVFAGRHGHYETAGRLVTSRVFKHFQHLLIGVPKDAGMFFVAPGNVAGSLCRMSCNPPFIVAMLGFCDLPLISVPVVRHPRESGKSSYRGLGRLRAGFGALACALQLKYSPKEIK